MLTATSSGEAVEQEIAEMQGARLRADIEASKRQALEDLRAEVAEIVLAAAEQVVEQSLDRDQRGPGRALHRRSVLEQQRWLRSASRRTPPLC